MVQCVDYEWHFHLVAYSSQPFSVCERSLKYKKAMVFFSMLFIFLRIYCRNSFGSLLAVRFDSIPNGSSPIFDFIVLAFFLSPLFKCMDLKQVNRFSTPHNEIRIKCEFMARERCYGRRSSHKTNIL